MMIELFEEYFVTAFGVFLCAFLAFLPWFVGVKDTRDDKE